MRRSVRAKAIVGVLGATYIGWRDARSIRIGVGADFVRTRVADRFPAWAAMS